MIPRPANLRQGGVILWINVLSMFQSGVSAGAEIAALTQGPFYLSKGDQITLEVRPKRPSSRVEWWNGRDLICEQPRCTVDTSNYTPGEYRYEVVVVDEEGMATANVAVSANETRPLYVPRILTPSAIAITSSYTVVKNGEWLIVARAGGVTVSDPRNKLRPKRVDSFAGVTDEVVYSVGAGSQAILRRIGFDEEWLISSGSSFKFRKNSFELLSGQGIWRVVNTKNQTTAGARVAGAKITSEGAVFLHATIGQTAEGSTKALLRNYEGIQVALVCGDSRPATIESAASKVIALDDSGACRSLEQEVFNAGDPTLVIRAWYPWWVGKGTPTSFDKWRAEWNLLNDKRPEEQILADATAAQSMHRCSDVLDMIGNMRQPQVERGKFAKLTADCQFSLGLFAKSLATYTVLDAARSDPVWAAFMIARSNQMLGHHRLALSWYSEALKRGFPDKKELAKYAIEAAKSDNNPREQLRWMEFLSTNETEDALYLSSMSDVKYWRMHRPWGGVVTGQILMDSQALPVNAKKTAQMPQYAKMSRSPVLGAAASWWATRESGQDLTLKIKGTHDLYVPREPSIVFASRSVHDVTAEIIVGRNREEYKNDLDRWTGLLAGTVGTGISGSERQRDRLGWSLKVSRPRWSHLTFGIKSDKYLDPNPGGLDLIDLDLNRYTGAADHSHLDLVFQSSVAGGTGIFSWEIAGEYGNVDYRTSVMDQFDHALVRLSGAFSWSVARRVELFLDPDFLLRTYKTNGGTDQTTGFRSGARVLVAPLWIALLDIGLENRNVSKDDTSSWLRLVYGLGVSAEL